jgi:hypothetical protein
MGTHQIPHEVGKILVFSHAINMTPREGFEVKFQMKQKVLGG